MLEDSNHALWLATAEAGIFRMDRDSVIHYSRAEGLPTENVTCLAAAKNGDIWACTDSGAVRIHEGKLAVFPTEHPVRTACEARDGTIWMGGDGASLLAWDGAKFTSRKIAKLPADASIRALECSDDGLWVGTSAGLVPGWTKTASSF